MRAIDSTPASPSLFLLQRTTLHDGSPHVSIGTLCPACNCRVRGPGYQLYPGGEAVRLYPDSCPGCRVQDLQLVRFRGILLPSEYVSMELRE
jgi:hypothetical protein